MAPPHGGAFDFEHKLLDQLNGLCRKRFDFRVELAPPRYRLHCLVSFSEPDRRAVLRLAYVLIRPMDRLLR